MLNTWRIFCLCFIPSSQRADFGMFLPMNVQISLNLENNSMFNLKPLTTNLWLYLLPTESNEHWMWQVIHRQLTCFDKNWSNKRRMNIAALTCLKNNINPLHVLDSCWLLFWLHYIIRRTNLDPPCAKFIGTMWYSELAWETWAFRKSITNLRPSKGLQHSLKNINSKPVGSKLWVVRCKPLRIP